MLTKVKCLLIGTLPLIAVLAVVLITTSNYQVYAKGIVKSSPSSESDDKRSDDRDSASSKDKGSSRSDSDRNSTVEQRREKSDESKRDNRSSSDDQASHGRKGYSPGDTTPPAAVNRNNTRGSSADSDNTRIRPKRYAPQRTQISEINSNSRKRYEGLGQIWRDRTERRDTVSDHRKREHSRQDDRYTRSFNGRYRYYWFDYNPGYTWPSVYCFYYGHVPPYVHHQRIYFVNHDPFARYVYADIPLTILTTNSYGYGNYYLATPSYNNVAGALNDIRQAWERSDIGLLMRHVGNDAQIEVYLEQDYAYSLQSEDYRDITADAISSVNTVDFSYYKLRQRNNNEVVAYARHTYYDDFDDQDRYYDKGKYRKTVYVGYTLRRYGRDWYITEVGSSPYQL